MARILPPTVREHRVGSKCGRFDIFTQADRVFLGGPNVNYSCRQEIAEGSETRAFGMEHLAFMELSSKERQGFSIPCVPGDVLKM